ncbi:sporulation membrane protein YtaF [Caproiciproducens galactitolivorans]|uniref:Sporulation membrane protein YtaF n=1 Tax=Caproiciproducens galactitolivorans TaxID=642589 RepID=A0ABT4BPB3_9FIRM|nr:sporulation membrane protein YtaF [Caproiciproducens galactitolivorans]MCY1712722.1 sporulation membrane protein YtaF [Caproiciproducens galactitolivorans]
MNVNVLSALLFALSANLDNFAVAITFGMRKIRIGFFINVLIAVIIGAGTFFSMSIGRAVSRFLPAGVSNILGGILLIGIGVWFLKDFFKKPEEKEPAEEEPKIDLNRMLKEPEKADIDHSGTIDAKESAILALALTINNFGMGVGASFAGLEIYSTTACTFFVSMLFIALGYRVGEKCIPKFLSRYVSLLSGAIVIILGIYEMIF